jgi:hypothetical protein
MRLKTLTKSQAEATTAHDLLNIMIQVNTSNEERNLNTIIFNIINNIELFSRKKWY